jgi:hypothetical protein
LQVIGVSIETADKPNAVTANRAVRRVVSAITPVGKAKTSLSGNAWPAVSVGSLVMVAVNAGLEPREWVLEHDTLVGRSRCSDQYAAVHGQHTLAGNVKHVTEPMWLELETTRVAYTKTTRPMSARYCSAPYPSEPGRSHAMSHQSDGRRKLSVQSASRPKERMAPEHQKLDLRKAPLMRLQIAGDPFGLRWFALLQLHHSICAVRSLDTMLAEVRSFMERPTEELPESLPYRNHVSRPWRMRETTTLEHCSAAG